MAILFATMLLLGLVNPQETDLSGIELDEDPDAPTESVYESPIERTMRWVFNGLSETTDWETHWTYLAAAIEDVYAQNGWDSEPDAFSLSLIREVGAIPPWELQARFDAISARVADRYLLDEEQELMVRELLLREANAMFVRHAGRVLPTMIEAIDTRLGGEPFTAEQVARWSEAMGPILDDARRETNRAALEFMTMLDADQQALALADLGALHNRLERVEEFRELWEQGDWDPSDWGLDSDPIQWGVSVTALEGASPEARGASPTATSRPAESLDPWAVYVREYVRRYELDDSQQQRAWIIYERSRERRDFQASRFEHRLERRRRHLATAESEKLRQAVTAIEAAREATLDLVFKAMKRQLDRLPTRAQRRAGRLPVTTAPATQASERGPMEKP